MKSIIQSEKRCYICGTEYGTIGSYTHKMGNDDIRGPRYCKVGSNYDTYYVKRYVVYVDMNSKMQL